MAWFIIAVGPSIDGPDVLPTLYLDCSSKYFQKWTIGKFKSLSKILNSKARKKMISSANSKMFCVPSDRHAFSNDMLEEILKKYQSNPVFTDQIRRLVPDHVKHPYNL